MPEANHCRTICSSAAAAWYGLQVAVPLASLGSRSMAGLLVVWSMGMIDKPASMHAKAADSRSILNGEALTLYNGGHLKRDWTYVDDIVDGFVRALDADLGYEIDRARR